MFALGTTLILTALAGSAPAPATSDKAQRAAELGLAFLEEDATEWKKERKCASCHQGVMTVWVVTEAKALGYAVKPGAAEEFAAWVKGGVMPRLEAARELKTGAAFNPNVSLAALYLSLLALAVPEQTILSPDELRRLRTHVERFEEPDGSWSWAGVPRYNSPPPAFESAEVVTLQAYLALDSRNSGADATPAANSAREKTVRWLREAKATETVQALGLRLVVAVRSGRPPEEIQRQVEQLIAKQNANGGWGPERGLASDAFATGQALYFLRIAGADRSRAEIQRAVAFLVDTQDDDGSWAMTCRPHPGEKSFTNPSPITYLGTSWATLALMRTFPATTPKP